MATITEQPKSPPAPAQDHSYPTPVLPYPSPYSPPFPPPPPGYPPPFFAYPPPPDPAHPDSSQQPVPPAPYMMAFAPGMVYAAYPTPPGPAPSMPAALAKPKRKQVKMACTNCAAACKRCDEARPCERCVKYGMTSSCIDGQRKERKKGIKRGPYKRKNKSDNAAFPTPQPPPQATVSPTPSAPPPPHQFPPPPPEAAGFYQVYYSPPGPFLHPPPTGDPNSTGQPQTNPDGSPAPPPPPIPGHPGPPPQLGVGLSVNVNGQPTMLPPYFYPYPPFSHYPPMFPPPGMVPPPLPPPQQQQQGEPQPVHAAGDAAKKNGDTSVTTEPTDSNSTAESNGRSPVQSSEGTATTLGGDGIIGAMHNGTTPIPTTTTKKRGRASGGGATKVNGTSKRVKVKKSSNVTTSLPPAAPALPTPHVVPSSPLATATNAITTPTTMHLNNVMIIKEPGDGGVRPADVQGPRQQDICENEKEDEDQKKFRDDVEQEHHHSEDDEDEDGNGNESSG